MSQTTTDRPPASGPPPRSGKAADWADERLHRVPVHSGATLNKVFPDHWSFMMGEIALYSFIILLLSGIYLTLFFDPSMAEVVYNGSYCCCAASRCRGRTTRR